MVDTVNQSRIRPRFLGTQGNRFFTLQFRASTAARGHVIYLPPFGEEMNRCRALVAEQARRLSDSGYHCTLVDYVGTGDSEGSLVDATLPLWRDNIGTLLSQLREEEALPVTLWGLRLGALVALDYCAEAGADEVDLLFWQPVTSGKRFVSQMLRQRVAARVSAGQPAETTAEIRERLREGEAVEISGYTVAEGLISGIESLSIAALAPAAAGRVFWFENVEEGADGPGTPSVKAIDTLRSSGGTVEVHLFHAPPIWQLHKRDEAPELIRMTTEIFAGQSAG